MVKLYLLLAILVSLACAFYCPSPQRVGYMSYSTLIDYDNLTGLFRKIDEETNSSECLNITQSNVTYSLRNIKPSLYYLESKQNMTYINDQYRANVTGGALKFSLQFDYEITYQDGTILSGKANTINSIDEFWFTKAIINEKGQLRWKVDIVNDLILREPILISSSTPKLPFDDKLQIESILNGNVSDCKSKETALSEINKVYKADLGNWLQNQHLLTTTNIKYQYKANKTVQYMNHPFEFGLTQRGFVYEFHFEVDQYTDQCVLLNDTFEKVYGGNQQKIAMSQLAASAKKALNDRWFDVDLDRDWQIQQFQYYMGDLANYVQKAKEHRPAQPFKVRCEWDNSLYDIQIQSHEKNQIYATVPYLCTFTTNETLIQKISFSLGMVLTLTATRQSLVVTIYPSVGTLGTIFTQMNGYKVTSYEIATQCFRRILASIIGTKTLGTGFPTNKRDKPAIKVWDQFVLIYDAAEPY